MSIPQPGDRYVFNASNPFLITPHYVPVEVQVVWFDGLFVHYRKATEPSLVKQATLERFLEIAEPLTQEA